MSGAAHRIPLARPCTGADEAEAAAAVLVSGRLVCGPRVEAFEASVAAAVGVRHAVAFSSGTSALWAALRCLGLGQGDEVIVPALTFPATAGAAVMNGATPVLADVDPGSFNIDPAEFGRRITSRTRIVVAVDQFGAPADYPAMEGILRRHPSITLVEDAACSLGSSLDGTMCGRFGEAAILSFHPRKVVTTGEGGAVVTDHEGLASSLRALRSHGQDPQGRFVAPGMNLRMGEMAAAVGEVQMRKLERLVARRRALAGIYERLLPGSMRMQRPAPTAGVNHQTLAAILPEGADRDRFIASMRERGMEVGVASYCLAALPAYGYCGDPADYPAAMRVHALGVALPLYPDMSEGDVEEVAAAARAILGGSG